MNNLPEDHQKYYKAFCNTQPNQIECMSRKVSSWKFGDSDKMAEELLNSVLSGAKTATSGLVISQEYYKESLPEVGERSIILDGKNAPRCIIETTKVLIIPYHEVDEDYALKEGEGFTSLKDWQVAHHAFFTRECKRMNTQFDENMKVVCEEFKVIYSSS